MTHTLDRRTFLRWTGAAVAGSTLAPLATSVAWGGELSTPNAARIGWRLAVQLYTFRGICFYEALEKISSLGIEHVEPAFFLRLDAQRPELQTNENLSAELRKELKQRMADYGIHMTNYYADLTTDEEAAKRVFAFAKEMGVETIVSEPPPEAFDMIERLCDAHEINMGVHNHPRGPQSQYWDPESVLAVCRNRGKRIGACCDTGHWVRSGLHPVESLKKLEGRVVTFHLKDVAEWGKPEARDVPLGQGVADYTAILTELKRQSFRGVMTVEYEHESPQLVEEVAECLAFVEKFASKL